MTFRKLIRSQNGPMHFLTKHLDNFEVGLGIVDGFLPFMTKKVLPAHNDYPWRFLSLDC